MDRATIAFREILKQTQRQASSRATDCVVVGSCFENLKSVSQSGRGY